MAKKKSTAPRESQNLQRAKTYIDNHPGAFSIRDRSVHSIFSKLTDKEFKQAKAYAESKVPNISAICSNPNMKSFNDLDKMAQSNAIENYISGWRETHEDEDDSLDFEEVRSILANDLTDEVYNEDGLCKSIFLEGIKTEMFEDGDESFSLGDAECQIEKMGFQLSKEEYIELERHWEDIREESKPKYFLALDEGTKKEAILNYIKRHMDTHPGEKVLTPDSVKNILENCPDKIFNKYGENKNILIDETFEEASLNENLTFEQAIKDITQRAKFELDEQELTQFKSKWKEIQSTPARKLQHLDRLDEKLNHNGKFNDIKKDYTTGETEELLKKVEQIEMDNFKTVVDSNYADKTFHIKFNDGSELSLKPDKIKK